MLTISCRKEKEDEHKEKNARRKFSYSSFERSFTLPESMNAEKIDTGCKDGLLATKLPEKAQARKEKAK